MDMDATDDPDEAIAYWTRKAEWPSRLFEPGTERPGLGILARRRPPSPAPSYLTDVTPVTDDDEFAQYCDGIYALKLERMGSFLDGPGSGTPRGIPELCASLLHGERTLPVDSQFRDDVFIEYCKRSASQGKAQVIQDISPLIVPRAETLEILYGAEHLKILSESVGSSWTNSIPFLGPRPQPDYSVGFKWAAFTSDQLQKLAPYIGDISTDASYFLGPFYLFFPFLTCQVNGDLGHSGLSVADTKNAHSMTMAVRGLVALFQRVGREAELDGQVLAFSVSHDRQDIRIYGHYAVITPERTEYYRHPIYTTNLLFNRQDLWTAYRFTRNVYDVWVPGHFERICSAIDQLPLEKPLEEGSS